MKHYPLFKYRVEYITENKTPGSVILNAKDEHEAERQCFRVCTLAVKVVSIILLREVK
jgi:hypothetical protein